jgi:helix-turn-helix protein
MQPLTSVEYGRYGYSKMAGLLEQAGRLVNEKRVERIWRREKLKVRKSSPNEVGSGWQTGHASGCGLSTAITCGPTTSSRTAPMTEGSIECSMSSTRSLLDRENPCVLALSRFREPAHFETSI